MDFQLRGAVVPLILTLFKGKLYIINIYIQYRPLYIALYNPLYIKPVIRYVCIYKIHYTYIHTHTHTYEINGQVPAMCQALILVFGTKQIKSLLRRSRMPVQGERQVTNNPYTTCQVAMSTIRKMK